MENLSFWYEIDSKAGMAYDKQTGEDAKAHTHVDISFGRTLTEEEYTILHEEEVLSVLAEKTGIDSAHLKPIAKEDYLAATEGKTGIHSITKTFSL